MVECGLIVWWWTGDSPGNDLLASVGAVDDVRVVVESLSAGRQRIGRGVRYLWLGHQSQPQCPVLLQLDDAVLQSALPAGGDAAAGRGRCDNKASR